MVKNNDTQVAKLDDPNSVFSGPGSPGLVPDPGSSSGNFLKDDGTWASAGGGGTDPTAIHTDQNGEINGLTAKTTPINTDEIVIEDSEATYSKKKVALSSLKVQQFVPFCGYPAMIGGHSTGWLRIFEGELNITTIEDRAQLQMPKCKVVAIRGNYYSGGSAITLTIRKNGVDTAITGTISAVGDFEITGEVDFADKDKLSLAFSTGSGSGAALQGLVVVYETEVV